MFQIMKILQSQSQVTDANLSGDAGGLSQPAHLHGLSLGFITQNFPRMTSCRRIIMKSMTGKCQSPTFELIINSFILDPLRF